MSEVCMLSRTLAPLTLVAALGCLSGCAASQKKPLVEAVAKNPDQRRSAFEATLRVLDEHPEYVDELYAGARQHPRTLDRFLANAARDLEEPGLAATTSALLAANPRSLEQVQVSSIDASKGVPAARAAIDRAMTKRATIVADIMTDSPETVRISMNDLTKAAEQKPAARAAFLTAMQESSTRIAEILGHDPKTMAVVTEALLKQGLKDRPALKEPLKKLGLVDADTPPAPAAGQPAKK